MITRRPGARWTVAKTDEQRSIDRERSSAFWQKKRARGQCTATGCRNQSEINPATGLPFWHCRQCRRRQPK